MEEGMQTLNELSKNIGQLPIEHLVGVVLLAGFGLSAFAIYAVFSIAREKGRP